MIKDLLISIAASLVSSGLTGLLGNKAVSKQNSIILKVYIQFLSVVVFVVTAMLSVILNRDFTSFIAGISEVNMLCFYSNCLNGFIWILLLVAIVANLDRNAVKVEHSVYDYIVYDSSTIERPFALALDNDPDVKMFFIIPDRFKIDTPIGSYNPNWAVYLTKNGEEKLYSILESSREAAFSR